MIQCSDSNKLRVTFGGKILSRCELSGVKDQFLFLPTMEWRSRGVGQPSGAPLTRWAFSTGQHLLGLAHGGEGAPLDSCIASTE